MSTDSPTWPHVHNFALAMESKLAKNRHKGDRAGWLKSSPADLLHRLRGEVIELEEAIALGCPPDEVLKEAADVGNFAMMVADSYFYEKHR